MNRRTPKTPPAAGLTAADVLRILDAAANRGREGLRVIEDYVRFVLDDPHLTELCKQLRHDLAAALSPISDRQPHGRPRNAGGRRHRR